MALTKVGPAGIGSTPGTGYTIGDSFLHSTGLEATNANFSGIVTAQTFRVLGNFQVDGTTTTLDTEVTSVDKLEIDANNNTVAVAVTQSGSGDAAIFMGGKVGIGTVAPQRILHTYESTSNNLLFLESGDLNVDIVQADTAGSTRLRSASGAFKFYTNGASSSSSAVDSVEKFSITSAGKVGIGTNNPSSILHLSDGSNDCDLTVQATASGKDARINLYGNSSGVSQIRLGDESSGNVGLITYDHSSNFLSLRTNSTEKFRITSDGKVGINTTAPNTKLQIVTTSGARALTLTAPTLGPYMVFETDGTPFADIGSLSGLIGSGSDTDTLALNARGSRDLAFRTNSTVRLSITSGGDIGIGLTNPEDKLHLSASNHGIGADFTLAKNLIRFEDTDVTQSNNQVTGGILFEGHDTDSNAAGLQAAIICNAASSGGNGGSQLRFYTTTGGSTITGGSAEKLRITEDGRVAIGTPSDVDHTLCVAGTDNTTSLTGGHSQGIQLQNKSTTDGTYSQIEWRTSSGGRYARIAGIQDDANGNGGQLVFLTESAAGTTTEALRITSEGVLSYKNASPPAWQVNTGYANAIFGSSAYLRTDTDVNSNFVSIGSNAYRHTDGWKHTNAGWATQLQTTANSGDLTYSVSTVSGSANDNITWNEAIRVTGAGNITASNTQFTTHVHQEYTGFNDGSSVVNYLLVCPTTNTNVRFVGTIMTGRHGGASGVGGGMIDVALIGSSTGAADKVDYNIRSMSTHGSYAGPQGQWCTIDFGGTTYYAIRFSSSVSDMWGATPQHCSFNGYINNCTPVGKNTGDDTLANETILTTEKGRNTFQNTKIGLDTVSPYYKFDVRFNNADTALSGGGAGNWAGNGIRLQNNNTTVGSMSLIHFRTGDNADWHIGTKFVGTGDSDIVFLQEGENEKLRIKNNGNIGINSTGGAAKVEIGQSNGNIAFRMRNSSAYSNRFQLYARSSGDGDLHTLAYYHNNNYPLLACSYAGTTMSYGSVYAGRTRSNAASPTNYYAHGAFGFYAYSGRTDDPQNYRSRIYMRAWDAADNGDRNIISYVDSGSDTEGANTTSDHRFGVKADGAVQGQNRFFSGRVESDAGTPSSVYGTGRGGIYGYDTNSSAAVYFLAENGGSSSTYFAFARTGDNDTRWRHRTSDGRMSVDATSSVFGGADYAEYFEWSDGNSNNEDRVGYCVVLKDGNKIGIATAGDSPSSIIGVISGAPAIIGDGHELSWRGKWKKDEFGREETTPVQYLVWNHGYENDENGNKVPVKQPDPTYQMSMESADSQGEIGPKLDKMIAEGRVPQFAIDNNIIMNSTRRVEDPLYDKTKKYVPREFRQEWDAVGLVGKLIIRKGQVMGDRWIKMKDINENLEQWLVR